MFHLGYYQLFVSIYDVRSSYDLKEYSLIKLPKKNCYRFKVTLTSAPILLCIIIYREPSQTQQFCTLMSMKPDTDICLPLLINNSQVHSTFDYDQVS